MRLLAIFSFIFWFSALVIGLLLALGPIKLWHPDGYAVFTGARLTFVVLGTVAVGCVSYVGLRALGWRFFKALRPPLLTFTGSALLLVFFSDALSHRYSLFLGPTIRGELILGFLVGLACIAHAISATRRDLLIFSGFSGGTLAAECRNTPHSCSARKPAKNQHFTTFATKSRERCRLVSTSRAREVLWKYLVVAMAIAAASSFLFESQGHPLVSDDHATFFFRLEMLKRNFPAIPFYHPLWNAGLDARDFFATGSLNVFLPFSWLIYFIPLEYTYNVIIVLLLFGAAPLSFYFAARLERVPHPGPWIASLLVMATSLLWYRWALKYGTLGFVTSTILFPLSFALARRVISVHQAFTWKMVVPTVVVISLCIFWSPAGLAFIPLALYGLSTIHKKWWLRPAVITVLFSLCAVNIPWILLFLKVSKVAHFVDTTHQSSYSKGTTQLLQDTQQDKQGSPLLEPAAVEKKKLGTFRPRAVLRAFKEQVVSSHPLLLLFGIPGLFFLHRTKVIPYLLTSGWLFILSIVVAHLKPQLELGRLFLVLLALLTIPTALYLTRLARLIHWRVLLLKRTSLQGWFGSLQRCKDSLPLAAAFSFLLVTPFVVLGILRNRSLEQFHFAGATTYKMADAISAHNRGGRFFFSGFVLHELDEGHLAPLVIRTGAPLMAYSWAHNMWAYKQIIPNSFLSEGDSGIDHYLDLFNVSAVFAHEPYWKRYFRKRSDEFKEVWQDGKFVLYERLHFIPSYFLEGQGTLLSQNDHEVSFMLDSPDAVLKFAYFPFLTIEGCQLESMPLFEEMAFIKVSHCPTGVPLTLKSRPAWWRLLS